MGVFLKFAHVIDGTSGKFYRRKRGGREAVLIFEHIEV